MRRRNSRRNDKSDIDMTPMLDIVFILLIFFIVTATFLQEEGVDMRPPPPSDEPAADNPVILVQLDNQNRVFVNQESTSEFRVLAAVSRLRAEQPQSAVLIEVAPDARHGTMVRIWDEMRANNIPVSISRAAGSDAGN
ncbi:MAG: biopolymer transporter ExbD [Alphaproteobacteria bacterium]|nr:biopolymer transporter ExbD [Alphaproteobacteria bacterium]